MKFLRRNAPDFAGRVRQLVAPNEFENKRSLRDLISKLERVKPRPGPPRPKIPFEIARSVLEKKIKH